MAENKGREIPVNIEEEMKASYLDYAMSVIIGRALPDVRDGLKPVHRRILYAMHELSNTFGRAHKKSARIVGEVIGKFHPHGETAVYDTMVRMAQDFSMGEMLIDGQGNFGSIDGDSPAAMRYTEVRMSRIAEELLADLGKETVDFQPNYDESLTEPLVLPGKFPNLLVNGASGIAVGMATNIPPHNLAEVVDALLLVIDRPDAALAELMELIPGPDFPTGGLIYGRAGIRNAYLTGRGILRVRAKTSVEPIRNEREAIIINELPYQVNKARLIEKIAQLVSQKRIQGISDLRDESDRRGMRVVIELKRGEHPEIVLNTLFKLTPMQSSFGVILLAIVEGRPQVLTLGQILDLFIQHRKVVVRRRTQYDLEKAESRAHILEGLRKALDQLDAIIELIRASASPAEAREGLIQKFEFSDPQAQAILDMKLQRLTGLEREKIDQEYEQTLQRIEELKAILENPEILRQVIKDELLEIQKNYRRERRTQILESAADLTEEDLIAEEQMVVTATHSGYIKRTPLSLYRSQHRGGKGRIGMSTRTEEDVLDSLFVASTHSYVLIFTSDGRLHWLKVWMIPEVGAAGKGKPIVNLINVDSEDRVAAVLSVQDFDQPGFIVMVSRRGYIKRTALSAFSNPRSTGIIACSVDEGDELMSVALCQESDDIVLFSRQGMAIRFPTENVRPMGRTARGVRGINLRKGDELVAMDIVRDEDVDVLAVTENGFGKRTPISEYRRQGRAGIGIINIKTSARNGPVVAACPVKGDTEIIIITSNGKIIRLETARIRQTVTRSAQGVKLIDMEEGDKVADVSVVPPEDEATDEGDQENGGSSSEQEG